MPWHLVDVWWDLGKDVPFQSYSIDVTISDDVPSSSNSSQVRTGNLDRTLASLFRRTGGRGAPQAVRKREDEDEMSVAEDFVS